MSRLITVKDLELFYSGMPGHPFLNLGDVGMLMKEAGAVTTELTPQYFNYVYGANVWKAINLEANAFAALPKVTWSRTGWRVIKALPTTADTIAISQSGALPDPVRPELHTIKAPPKVQSITFEITEVFEELAGREDDVWGSTNQIKTEYGTMFAKLLNQQIMRKAIETTGSGSEASAGNKLEALDRIVSGYSESQIDTSGASDPVGAAVDVYGIDRHTAASWADAVVYHNNGTNRDLSDELIRNLIQDVRTKGGNPTFFMTGYDTYAKIQGLYTTFIRYINPMSEATVQLGVEGVKTAQGSEVGINVATLYGLPLITTVDAPKDGISRVFLLDTSDLDGAGQPRTAISVLRPIEYFEARDPILLNKFVIKGAYRFVGEVIGRALPFNGKIRDLE